MGISSNLANVFGSSQAASSTVFCGGIGKICHVDPHATADGKRVFARRWLALDSSRAQATPTRQ